MWLLLFTALASWLGTFAVLRMAPRMGLVHEPNDRSSHSAMVSHGGGLGIVLAGSIAGSLLVSPLTPTPLPEGEGPRVLAVLGLALPLALMGLLDDIRHVSARIRFAAQGTVVAALLWLMGPLPEMALTFPQGGEGLLIGGWLLSGLLFFAGIWWVNLFNFMDGIDGIAGVEAISILSIAAGLAFFVQPDVINSTVWWLMLCVVSATLGFLLLNWPPARIFMGDVGSTWLAFVIFALALLSIQSGWLSYAAWVILAALFVSDATVTLLTRMVRGERWYEAHRSHAYQRLSRRFFIEGEGVLDESDRRAMAHRRVTLGVLLINLLWLTPLAFASMKWPQWFWWLAGIAYLPLVAGALLLRAGRQDHA
jgi:Fuc2NAc and GlcNAc transferase